MSETPDTKDAKTPLTLLPRKQNGFNGRTPLWFWWDMTPIPWQPAQPPKPPGVPLEDIVDLCGGNLGALFDGAACYDEIHAMSSRGYPVRYDRAPSGWLLDAGLAVCASSEWQNGWDQFLLNQPGTPWQTGQVAPWPREEQDARSSNVTLRAAKLPRTKGP